MIAKPKSKVTAKHQEQFTQMLPTITRMASIAFRDLDPEGKEEATAEVVAHAFVMFAGLVERGREAVAYPSVLAMYGIRRVRIGRMAATKQNVRDISSTFCQQQKGVTLQRLDKFDREEDAWQEVVVEDRHAGPAEIAATRIDFRDWLQVLSLKQKKAAEKLAVGESTSKVAKMLGVSPGRISQLRRELLESWKAFQSENPLGLMLSEATA